MKISLKRFIPKYQAVSSVPYQQFLHQFPKRTIQKTPTAKQLRESDTIVLYRYRTNSECLTFLNNGFVLCEYQDDVKVRTTVLPIDKMKFTYQFCTSERVVVSEQEYLSLPFITVILMLLTLRVSHNVASREDNKIGLHLDNDGNDFAKEATLPDIADKIVDNIELARNIEQLRKCLTYLTPNQRQAIWCCFYNEMTQEDAATELGIKRSSVQSRLQLALENIKKYF